MPIALADARRRRAVESLRDEHLLGPASGVVYVFEVKNTVRANLARSTYWQSVLERMRFADALDQLGPDTGFDLPDGVALGRERAPEVRRRFGFSRPNRRST